MRFRWIPFHSFFFFYWSCLISQDHKKLLGKKIFFLVLLDSLRGSTREEVQVETRKGEWFLFILYIRMKSVLLLLLFLILCEVLAILSSNQVSLSSIPF